MSKTSAVFSRVETDGLYSVSTQSRQSAQALKVARKQSNAKALLNANTQHIIASPKTTFVVPSGMDTDDWIQDACAVFSEAGISGEFENVVMDDEGQKTIRFAFATSNGLEAYSIGAVGSQIESIQPAVEPIPTKMAEIPPLSDRQQRELASLLVATP